MNNNLSRIFGFQSNTKIANSHNTVNKSSNARAELSKIEQN